MEKEIHFYESEGSCAGVSNVLHGWCDVRDAIGRDQVIHTTQMGLMSTRLIEGGYCIYVHTEEGQKYEIRLGSNDCTDKEIRPAHNLFRMWQGNAFEA